MLPKYQLRWAHREGPFCHATLHTCSQRHRSHCRNTGVSKKAFCRAGEAEGRPFDSRLSIKLGAELTLHGDGEDADRTQCPLPLEGVSMLLTGIQGQILGQSFGLLEEVWLQEKAGMADLPKEEAASPGNFQPLFQHHIQWCPVFYIGQLTSASRHARCSVFPFHSQ